MICIPLYWAKTSRGFFLCVTVTNLAQVLAGKSCLFVVVSAGSK